MTFTTHIKLYVECNRGESSMLFDLDLTVQEVMERIARWYEYSLEGKDNLVLIRIRGRSKLTLDPKQKIGDLGLWHEETVWFDVLTDL